MGKLYKVGVCYKAKSKGILGLTIGGIRKVDGKIEYRVVETIGERPEIKKLGAGRFAERVKGVCTGTLPECRAYLKTRFGK